MQTNLTHDKELKEIQFIIGDDLHTIKLGENDVTQIKVVSENGQMAEVPWVAVYVKNKLHSQYNCSELHNILFNNGMN